ncbi:hypothetical protein TTHERM_000059189 (macronuclear) [Tetrahymena thermophila SB210]|uniref:Uncharacterized protein n=1 Tax=Tetrahymena thermophila (strain SB210) TaxID=312017 RepID=W7XH59_TETTS|nr:hypothetical protein TTHERM_000059189 [Tetrahymena thermophila SB210]EWS76493.1 hypothetical protein TTHERM_000059189 [Tetrahymena thermophila SB210]|eukprot:XP_012650972.1 hypothetical protein TTHERM_000059189 [Tetrahymena thermophila SB210]
MNRTCIRNHMSEKHHGEQLFQLQFLLLVYTFLHILCSQEYCSILYFDQEQTFYLRLSWDNLNHQLYDYENQILGLTKIHFIQHKLWQMFEIGESMLAKSFFFFLFQFLKCFQINQTKIYQILYILLQKDLYIKHIQMIIVQLI